MLTDAELLPIHSSTSSEFEAFVAARGGADTSGFRLIEPARIANAMRVEDLIIDSGMIWASPQCPMPYEPARNHWPLEDRQRSEAWRTALERCGYRMFTTEERQKMRRRNLTTRLGLL